MFLVFTRTGMGKYGHYLNKTVMSKVFYGIKMRRLNHWPTRIYCLLVDRH